MRPAWAGHPERGLADHVDAFAVLDAHATHAAIQRVSHQDHEGTQRAKATRAWRSALPNIVEANIRCDCPSKVRWSIHLADVFG